MIYFHANIRLCAWWVLIACFAGCNKNDDKDDLLRSADSQSSYYAINNSDATKRLSSIMYNRTDVNRPVERFKLVHISDTHLSEWSGDNHCAHPNNLIESVTFVNQRELKINAMVETGDHISNASAQTARTCLASFFRFLYRENYVPTFSCYGNHDPNIDEPKDYIPSGELATAIHTCKNYPVKRESADKTYYYADVPNPQGGTIRFITLDMTDQPGNEYNTLHYAIYSQEQINWLGNVALKEGMTGRHSVIVLTHFPLQNSAWGGTKASVQHYLYNGDFVHTWKMIPEIIEAYRTRSSLNKTYPNKLFPGREGIRAEFDFTGAAGEFVCYLGGHTHCFALFDVQGTGNSALPPQKMILCTNQAPSEAGGLYNKVVRNENSVTSNSFNIYAIDTSEKKVYITFFGAYLPSDEPDFAGVQAFSYLGNPAGLPG
ncbi:MAG: metallophosphoesterase [Tannerellaceae bacterium]|jgi:predicted MPP superfamily phosphohydrolase|nr:metallophosphoesterase [Tannerellaceae bacterium]